MEIIKITISELYKNRYTSEPLEIKWTTNHRRRLYYIHTYIGTSRVRTSLDIIVVRENCIRCIYTDAEAPGATTTTPKTAAALLYYYCRRGIL